MSSAIYNIELEHQIRRTGVLPEYTRSLFCQRKPKPITRTGEGDSVLNCDANQTAIPNVTVHITVMI